MVWEWLLQVLEHLPYPATYMELAHLMSQLQLPRHHLVTRQVISDNHTDLVLLHQRSHPAGNCLGISFIYIPNCDWFANPKSTATNTGCFSP
jgi:hypothetical protein